jgi:hypothetical protein
MLLRLSNFFQAFWDLVDERRIVRRSCLIFTMYMTANGSYMAWTYANTSAGDEPGKALVIAAVLMPLATLQAFAFKQYADSR